MNFNTPWMMDRCVCVSVGEWTMSFSGFFLLFFFFFASLLSTFAVVLRVVSESFNLTKVFSRLFPTIPRLFKHTFKWTRNVNASGMFFVAFLFPFRFLVERFASRHRTGTERQMPENASYLKHYLRRSPLPNIGSSYFL